MQIKKRSLPMFILLNCLTLGIYGAVVSNQIGKEVNYLCKQDGEEPKFGYMGALLIRAIPAFIGVVVGLIMGIATSGAFNSFGNVGRQLESIASNNKAMYVFVCIIICTAVLSLIGHIFSAVYMKYWWFKQTGRLKVNANRYGFEVREKGTDHFAFRTAIDWTLAPASILLKVLSLFLPAAIMAILFIAGFSSRTYGALTAGVVIFAIAVVVYCIFGAEISGGASLSLYYTFKTLNRYEKVYRNGAKPFDPMAYDYYPCASSLYPTFVPQVINGTPQKKEDDGDEGFVFGGDDGSDTTPKILTGSLVGIKGDCAGYNFDLMPGEEIVIGKDAKVSSVVISTAYKEISRKHVSVLFSANKDRYIVTDYSSNGTWADGERLERGVPTELRRGTLLKLANDKNTFRLG